MQKLSAKARLRTKSINYQKLKLNSKRSNLRKTFLRYKKYSKLKKDGATYINQRRRILKNKIYAHRPYDEDHVEIMIKGELGIEGKKNINNFLKLSSKLMNINNESLRLNIEGCNGLWPSAVTMLCSFRQWIELTSDYDNFPLISSSTSNNDKVNSYLKHCGFYDYVYRSSEDVPDTNYYNQDQVVRIERERKRSNTDLREKSIEELLKNYSTLSDTNIAFFNRTILSEIFSNVTEHGISHNDDGWWIIAQYHENHKFISICIADNGIGIRNSLMTGPQRNELLEKYKDIPDYDGELIKEAMKPNISGAIDASIRSGQTKIFKKDIFNRGANRGQGLKHIKDWCEDLEISLSILSHHGYIFIDSKGKIIKEGSSKLKVFAGTMYSLVVKAK